MIEGRSGGQAEAASVAEPSGVGGRGTRAISQRYWSPYVAGIGLGLVLLTTFVLMGHGIGVSGAVTSVVATGVNAVAPAHAAANEYYQAYVGDTDPLRNWLVLEVAGIFLGGLVSAGLAGRSRGGVARGPRATIRSRLAYAFVGGAIMGFGSRLARGCTSGLALTGGAVLSVGAWAFMIAIFVAGYAVAPLMRKQWT